MMQAPKMSAALKKDHSGDTVISLNGKILGFGSDSIQALNQAKIAMPEIEDHEFLVSRVYPEYLAI